MQRCKDGLADNKSGLERVKIGELEGKMRIGEAEAKGGGRSSVLKINSTLQNSCLLLYRRREHENMSHGLKNPRNFVAQSFA